MVPYHEKVRLKMLFFPAKKASAGRWNNIMVLQKWKASAGNGRMEKNNGEIWGRALDGGQQKSKGGMRDIGTLKKGRDPRSILLLYTTIVCEWVCVWMSLNKSEIH